MLTLSHAGRVDAHAWPAHCSRAPAAMLCRIHRAHTRVNQLRARMQEPRIAYQWQAERYPARRARILAYWQRTQQRTQQRWHRYTATPWSAAWYAQAMCIHSKESINWADPGSPGGGMQFLESTWLAWGGGRYAPAPSIASPVDQLRVAYRVVQHDGGWREWTTAPMCGL